MAGEDAVRRRSGFLPDIPEEGVGAHRRALDGKVPLAIPRPAAWFPPPGAKLTRRQHFAARRRAVERYAAFLGINPVVERGLMWLAEEGLYAPLPPGWRELQDLHGSPVYVREADKTTWWEHPRDAAYRSKLRQLRGKNAAWGPGLSSRAGTHSNAAGRSSWRLRAFGALVLALIVVPAAWLLRERGGLLAEVDSDGPRLNQLACILGSAEACSAVGLAFWHGETATRKKSPAKALKWWLLAADAKHAEAQRMAATLLAKGDEGVAKDPAAASDLFHKAAGAGDVASMSALGFMYHRGEGLAVDPQQAVVWTKRGAERGDPNAMLLYASLFLAGQSLTRNPEEGYKWLTLAKRFGKGDAVLQAKAKQFHDQAAPLLTPPVRERALANAAKYVPIETPRYK